MKNFLRIISFVALFAFVAFAPFVTFAAAGDIVMNEIAWSGTKPDDTDEWIELKNNTSGTVSFEGWVLKALSDGRPTILLVGSIPAGGFYLIERTADSVVSDIAGDFVGSFGQYGNVANTGEDLVLLDASGAAVDEVRFASGWPAGTAGPDYFSMERIDSKKDGSLASNWASNNGIKRNGKDAVGNAINGTPKQENSVYNNPPPPSSPDSSSSPSSSSSASSPSSPSYPIYPPLGVDAGSDKTVLVGSSVSFSGSAVGINGALLLDARFLWNFGDGTLKEGKTWEYVYYFPGTYTAALTVSSGPYSGSDTAIITAIVPMLTIKNTQTGEDGFITIVNGADKELDLGGMIFRDSAGVQFIIPKNTFILAKGNVTFSNRVSGVLKSGGTVALFDAVGRVIREQTQTVGEQARTAERIETKSSKSVVKASPPSGAQTLNAGGETSDIGSETSITESIPDASQETAAASMSQNTTFGISKTSLFFGASVLIGLVSAAGFFLLKTFL